MCVSIKATMYNEAEKAAREQNVEKNNEEIEYDPRSQSAINRSHQLRSHNNAIPSEIQQTSAEVLY